MKKRIKCMNIVSTVTITVAILLLLHIGFLLMWPYKPAEFGKNPFPVENKVVKQGEYIKYSVEYHKLLDVPVTTQHMLIDHIQINFPPTNSSLPKGKYHLINNEIMIPPYITPGKAYIQVMYTFKVNAIRDVVMTARTEEFEIIAKD